MTALVTLEVLRQVYPDCPADRAAHFVEPLRAAMDTVGITTPARVAAFLAQAGHESQQLMRLEENLVYTSAEQIVRIFRSDFDGDRNRAISPAELADAQRFVRNPEALANRVYANQNGNGDEASGDGWRYRGRGIFQITGRANYRICSIAICADADTLLVNPEFLADPDYACMAAAWYWAEHDLNALADRGAFEEITRRINGGTHGLAERVALWHRGIEALA